MTAPESHGDDDQQRGLRSALRQWAEPQSFVSHYGDVPRRTRRAAKAVTKLASLEPRKPEPYDLKKLHERACEAADSDSILDLKRVDLRRLPWVLFYPGANSVEACRSWLGARPEVTRDYQNWLVTQRRRGTVRALVHEFLRVYPVDLPTFQDWLWLLRYLTEYAASRALQEVEPDLFVPNGDGIVVGRMVANRELDVGKLGLKPGLAQCHFLRCGTLKHLRVTNHRIKAGKSRRAEIDRLLSFLELDDGLRFDDGKMCGETAKALLLPFADPSHAGSASLDMVCAWFVRCFGDPRFPAHGREWRHVPKEAKTVVDRWLVRGTFEQFFQLLSYTAYDYHWRYRKAFWRAYLQRNMVEEAWFVLGHKARAILKHISSDESTWRNGALFGGNFNHSVLLMRIRGTTVAEWSHSGSCRIWRRGNRRAPKLYHDTYDRDWLASGTADFVQRHDGSDKGRWQDSIARQLQEYTGRTLRRGEYML